MPTITVKNIPKSLYESLRESAGANHRSIDREVIACIKRALAGQRIEPEEVLARARQLRATIASCPLTDALLKKAKSAGRP
jgi:plasmid stability protein